MEGALGWMEEGRGGEGEGGGAGGREGVTGEGVRGHQSSTTLPKGLPGPGGECG